MVPTTVLVHAESFPCSLSWIGYFHLLKEEEERKLQGLAWSNLNMLWPAFEAFVYWDFMLLKVIECLASNKELGIRDMSSSHSDSSVGNEFCSPVGKDVFSLFLEWLLVGNR